MNNNRCLSPLTYDGNVASTMLKTMALSAVRLFPLLSLCDSVCLLRIIALKLRIYL